MEGWMVKSFDGWMDGWINGSTIDSLMNRRMNSNKSKGHCVVLEKKFKLRNKNIYLFHN